MNNKWDERFMNEARNIAQWSKDPSSKCGAIIVDQRRIVRTGYNGFAPYVRDLPERYLDREFKLDNVIHCEENAIIQARVSVVGYKIYLTGMSCSRCTARIIAAGINEIIIPDKSEDAFSYREDWNKSFTKAADQCSEAGVFIKVLKPTGFNPIKLMGPQHPEMIRIIKAKNEAIKQIC